MIFSCGGFVKRGGFSDEDTIIDKSYYKAVRLETTRKNCHM